MNIFFVDNDPIIAAQSLVDKHVVKMILESAQLMSTVQRLNGNNNDKLYKLTHKNHPCTKWLNESIENYNWLYQHYIALCNEYTYRYNKVHKSESLKYILKEAPKQIKNIAFTDPPFVMPDNYVIDKNFILSYRNYYNEHKQNLFKWTKRIPPNWIILKV